MKKYTAEEIEAWSDAAVLHEAMEIVRAMAPEERRAWVTSLQDETRRSTLADVRGRWPICGAN